MLKSLDIPDGATHARKPCLKPDEFIALKLLSVKPLGEMVAEYTFALPHATDYTGCFPGQYVRVRLGKNQRFLSPVTRAKELGRISLLLKHETHGMFSNSMRALEIGKSNTLFSSLLVIGPIFTVSELTHLYKTTNNQRLGRAFDDLDSRIPLLCQVGDDVNHPCKISGGCQTCVPRSIYSTNVAMGMPRYARIPRSIHSRQSTLFHTISTPICIRSAFFLRQTQLKHHNAITM